MEKDFSNYKIHIPVEKTAASLLEPNKSTFPLKENEIYSYNEGIKIVQKEGRGLWLSDDLVHDRSIRNFFQEMGIIAN